jgi:hypothetical protein
MCVNNCIQLVQPPHRSSAAISPSVTWRVNKLRLQYGKFTAPNPDSTASMETPMTPAL